MEDEKTPITPRNPLKVVPQSLKEVFNDKLKSAIENQVKDIFISNFFKDTDWKSMDVRGNGFCLFYAFMAADKSEYYQSVDNVVLESFSKMVVDGIEKYYTAIKQHEDLIPPVDVPNILSAGLIILDFIEDDENPIIYDKSTFSLETFSSEKKTLEQHITTLLRAPNLNTSPRGLPVVLAYANDRNILQISYRVNKDIATLQNIATLQFDFFSCYTGITKDFKYPEYETTILFLKTGHFFPIFHLNETTKKKTIDLFKKIIAQNEGELIFEYDVKKKMFINKSKNITLIQVIQKAEAAIAAEEPAPPPKPEPAAEPPAAAPAAVEPGPAAEELKPAEELEPAPEPAPEKTLVQKLFKKQMIDYFKERKERNRKKGEEGGE